ncbi:MAG: hypothetical protein BWZ08_01722 [candidate division BRC1 bacterium ADurb.BinA292]|nr:MAG: hypothetical protein BWZ08_01722 [candidate division BRC1 bacterium ADurb.BinA292]
MAWPKCVRRGARRRPRHVRNGCHGFLLPASPVVGARGDRSRRPAGPSPPAAADRHRPLGADPLHAGLRPGLLPDVLKSLGSARITRRGRGGRHAAARASDRDAGPLAAGGPDRHRADRYDPAPAAQPDGNGAAGGGGPARRDRPQPARRVGVRRAEPELQPHAAGRQRIDRAAQPLPGRHDPDRRPHHQPGRGRHDDQPGRRPAAGARAGAGARAEVGRFGAGGPARRPRVDRAVPDHPGRA